MQLGQNCSICDTETGHECAGIALGWSQEVSAVTPLATLRRQRAWSQRERAKQAGVSPSVIVQLEAGRTRYPKYKVIRALATALGVQPRDVDEFRQMVDSEPDPRGLA